MHNLDCPHCGDDRDVQPWDGLLFCDFCNVWFRKADSSLYIRQEHQDTIYAIWSIHERSAGLQKPGLIRVALTDTPAEILNYAFDAEPARPDTEESE